MANNKLPTEADLGRKIYRASSPQVHFPVPDYSALAGGRRGERTGLAAIGEGLASLANADSEEQSHDVQRRMLDFKLETEMALEEAKRSMPVGGEGYAATWQQEYTKRANQFVGRGDANIPDALRTRVGTMLKQHEVMLGERAQRDEFAERDRHTGEQLGGTLARTRSAIEANPDRVGELQIEGEALIASARLTPAARDVAKRRWREQAQEAAANTIVDGVRDAESFGRARELLGPDKAERVTAKGVKDGILAPGTWRTFDTSTPTATERRRIRGEGGIVVNLDTNWTSSDRPTEPIVVIPDDASPAQRQAAEAYAAGIAKIYNDKFGTNLQPKVLTRSANGRGRNDTIHTEPYSVTDRRAAEFFTSDEGLSAHARLLGETFGKLPGVAFSLPHDPTRKGDRGAHGPHGNEVDLATPLLARLTNGMGQGKSQQPSAVPTWSGEGDTQPPGADGTTALAEYAGPFQDLSLAKRRTLMQRAESRMATVKTGVEQAIRSQMTVASDGYMPPDGVLEALRNQVGSINDPMLHAQLDALERQAALTQRFQKVPPAATEAYAAELRRQAGEQGATKEQLDAVKHLETVASSARRHLSEDALAYANKVGLVVPMADGPPADLEPAHRPHWRVPMAKVELEQIGFGHPDIDRMLATRFEWSKAIGRYYGTPPPPPFQKGEAEAIVAQLRQGGDRVPFIFGKIATAAARAGIEPAVVMKQFSKTDAPELAVIGEMVANNADPAIVKTAAAALSWRATEGEKFVSTIDKLQAQPTLGEYAQVLATQPTKVDAVRQTANLIYEFEARRTGAKAFEPTLYADIVKRVMGQTTDADGTAYGGVGTQGARWLDGKWSSKVLVPAPVRQDGFDAMVGALRARDLPDPPVDADGKALSIKDIRSATWVSLGPGVYVLERGRDATGERVLAFSRSGKPYTLDIRPLLPAIQQRRPDIFRGYDGSSRGINVPDPAFAFGLGDPSPPPATAAPELPPAVPAAPIAEMPAP